MIDLKRRTYELDLEALYCVTNLPIAGSSHTDLYSNSFSQYEEPESRSVRLVPLNGGGDQLISYANLHSMGREELLLIRRQLLQSLGGSEKLSPATESRTKSNPSPLTMSETEQSRAGKFLSTMCGILHAWASLA